MKKRILMLAMVLLVSFTGCAQIPNTDDVNNGDPAGLNENTEPASGGKDAAFYDKGDESQNTEPGIIGYVMKKEDGRILVVDSSPKDFSDSGGVAEFYDAIWFSGAPEDIEVGEKVKVWFGEVRESYPAQSSAKRIEVVTGVRPEGAMLTEAEAIAKALSSVENKEDFLVAVKSVEFDTEKGEWNIQLKDVHGDRILDITIEDGLSPESSKEAAPLEPDVDLALGRLKVNMTRPEIDGLMETELVRSEKDNAYGIESEYLHYEDGTIIHLVEGKIYSITVSSGYYSTPRGLKAGDPEERVRELYGEPSHIDEKGVWIYSSPGGYDLFYVTVQDGSVVSIMVSLVM